MARMALLPVSTPFTMWFCWALPLCVEHTPLPHDVGFRHGFVLASRMRRKWRCSSSKPHLQQVWVPPLVLGLLPSPWKEWAQDHFWFWKRCVVIGTGLFLPTPPVLGTLGSHRCGADLYQAQPGWTDCPVTLRSPRDLWDEKMST